MQLAEAIIEELPSEELASNMSNQLWRLNNLYSIVTDEGVVMPFRMKPSQEDLFWQMHYRTIILKARQHGFTTFMAIVALDYAMWNSNFSSGIIAHTLPHAQKIFSKKVLFAYKNLEPGIKAMAPEAIKVTGGEMEFSNGSSVYVSVSFRSGTLQLLHVSELGKIAANHPKKSEEIRTGAFEAVPRSGIIVVESTAEGAHGDFKDMVDRAQSREQSGRPLSQIEFKLHFVPWWKDQKYKLSEEEAKHIPIVQRMEDYFTRLAKDYGIRLTPRQKAWYVVKEAELGEMMWREYPSIPEEPFKVSLEGAYWAEQMRNARLAGRITNVPHTEGVPVSTWWDIGRDTTSIWFTQDVGMMVHVIDYYQNAGTGIKHYVEKLLEYGEKRHYRYYQHNLPHDGGVRDYSNEENESREQVANRLGLLNTNVLPRMEGKMDGIEAGRNFFQHCLFDEVRCDEGLAGLEAYRKEWDAIRGTWKDLPLHNWASHPADAFQQLALNHVFQLHQANRGLARPVQQERF